ncbi:MAG: Xaa-Pro peptidase family protein [Gemmatimonadota bacterium]
MSPDRRAERQAALRSLLEHEGLDTLLVQHLPNIRYLTGFSGSAALLLMRPGGSILISDFRYNVQAMQEVGNSARVEIDQVNVWDRLKRSLADAPPAVLAFEAHVTTVRDMERLAATTTARLEPVTDLIERLRVSKSPEEVEAIRRAAVLAQDALAETVPEIRVGETEFAIGARLESALRRRGSEWHPFPTIVASGPRSALPHARTSARTVGKGEWLLLDFGAQVDGYCADLTRTFIVGQAPDERQRTVYEVVRIAQGRALTNIHAGQTGREADALARDIISARGFGDSFGHSLGHGLGLEVHEGPRLSPTAEVILQAGAVVTIEPGIYLPGWGGVRLEDDIHLGADGPVCLSDNRTELVQLG